MQIKAFSYVGVAAKDLSEWKDYGTRFLGMQAINRSRDIIAFRMDDRSQRLIVNKDTGPSPAFFGWEVEDTAALDAIAARVEQANIKVRRGTRALAAERFVADLIVLHDPAGNRLEIVHGPEVADKPFIPGRNISGFRTGPLGMGHAVLTVTSFDEVMPFYMDVLGFRISDYVKQPFKAYFFHINQRHHSLALVETGRSGIHHLMVELYSLDDVGQGYDLALQTPEKIGVTFGRHNNDAMTSFYTNSPSNFMFEYGWGGRSIEPATWRPQELLHGTSLWGHERYWLDAGGRENARKLRGMVVAANERDAVHVIPGNYALGAGVCPWWDQMKTK